MDVLSPKSTETKRLIFVKNFSFLIQDFKWSLDPPILIPSQNPLESKSCFYASKTPATRKLLQIQTTLLHQFERGDPSSMLTSSCSSFLPRHFAPIQLSKQKSKQRSNLFNSKKSRRQQCLLQEGGKKI